ncbi:MAG: YgfZ/GcvT domain-containing protein [Planctomycetia bacterium]
MGDLQQAGGWLRLAGRRLVEVRGADGLGYLHRMLTQDVKGLAPGRAAPACSLTAQGRILAHLLLWHLPPGEAGAGPRLWLDVAAGAAPEALALLERYVIADDVTFHDLGAACAHLLLVTGDPAAACAQAGLGSAPACGEVLERVLPGGARAWLLAQPFGARTALHVLVEAAGAARLEAALAGVLPAWDAHGLDRARIEERVPWAGAELDERILPNEARLDDALCHAKGCYPGQEPVVMARDRGHPATLLVRVALEGAPGAAAGRGLLQGGRTVGRLTTVEAAGGQGRALGFVRHALARAGTALEVEGGGHARVE